MALLNRPMTEDEARRMVAGFRERYPATASLWNMIEDAQQNPTPHKVVYNGRTHAHVPPPTKDRLCLIPQPVVSEWHVPGTTEWKI